jgi:hypothetical protein
VVLTSSTVPWGRYAIAVSRLYELQLGAPVWLDKSGVSRPGSAAIQALLRAGEHGLNPADYDAAALDSVARSSIRSRLSATDGDRFDAQLSVDLIRYLDDLQFGRLHPPTLDRTGSERGIDLRWLSELPLRATRSSSS